MLRTNLTICSLALSLLLTPSWSAATSKIYQYKQENGVVIFTDRAPEHNDFVEVRLSCFACNVKSTLNWQKIPLYPEHYQLEIAQASQRYAVDEALVRALIHAESAFNPKAISKKGAQGLMQLMPQTAAELGVSNPMNAKQNINGGVKYLSKLLQRFDGDVRLATAAYNAGPGAVTRHGGIPPYAETQTYVKRVAILYQRYKNSA